MLLLDTCLLIWLDSNPGLVSSAAWQAIRDNAGALFTSSMSALEIAIKCRKGKLALPLSPAQWFPAMLSAHSISEIPLDWRIATHSATLPAIHADPADRVIVATAQTRALRIVTPDPLIHAYPNTECIW